MAKKIFDIFPPEGRRTNVQGSKSLPEREEPQPFFEKTLPQKARFFPKRLGWLAGLFTLLILVGIFFHFFLAGVKVEIWPKTQPLNFQEKIIINSQREQPDFLKKEISGKVFETTKKASQKFLTTGKVPKEESAQGIIRVYNNYHSSQTLVKNTRFQPSLEKKVLYFCSKKSVVIPPKSQLDIEVYACLPGGKAVAGPEYNIEPATFSIPGLVGLPQYYSIYGKSFSAMTGGFKGEVSVVSQEDLERAKKTLLEKLEKETKDYLKSTLSEDFILLEEGIWSKIVEATSSLPVLQEGESFDFTLEIKLKAILFKKSDLENFAKEFILSKISQEQKIQPEKLKINYSLESIDKTAGKIFLNLEISNPIYSDIDFTLLKKGLAEKSLKEAYQLLSDYQQIEKIRIKVFPFWLRKFPDDLRKIKIETKFD